MSTHDRQIRSFGALEVTSFQSEAVGPVCGKTPYLPARRCATIAELTGRYAGKAEFTPIAAFVGQCESRFKNSFCISTPRAIPR